MVQLTERAIGKVKEIMASQQPAPAGLRIAVVGGGCSGFSYSMAFENQPNMLDKTYDYSGLKVYVDQASMLYLDGAEVDFVESLEGAGFKFNNPNVKAPAAAAVHSRRRGTDGAERPSDRSRSAVGFAAVAHSENPDGFVIQVEADPVVAHAEAVLEAGRLPEAVSRCPCRPRRNVRPPV